MVAKKRKREEHPPKEVEQPKSKKARSVRGRPRADHRGVLWLGEYI